MKKFYITLDEIFDTRLSTLEHIYGEIKTPLISVDYSNRIVDKFFGMDREVFREFYDKRTNGTILNYPYPTLIFDMLKERILLIRREAALVNINLEVCLVINIFPYRFASNVLDSLIDSIRLSIPPSTYLEIISSKDELTPQGVIDAKYDTLIMYDGIKWIHKYLGLHGLAGITMTSVNMIAPALMDIEVPSDVEEAVFKDIMGGALPVINLELMSVGIMSTSKEKRDPK